MKINLDYTKQFNPCESGVESLQLKETKEKLNIAVELNKEMFRQLNKIETFSDEKATDSLISGYGYISAIIKNFKMFNESHLKTIQKEEALTKIKGINNENKLRLHKKI